MSIIWTQIEAQEDLYNGGKCFTKGEVYEVTKGGREITTEAGLMEVTATNDQSEPHLIGSWWRKFKIVGTKKTK